MLFSVALTLLLLVFVLVFPHARKRIKQRSLRNVPGPSSSSFFLGVTKEMNTPFSIPFRERVLLSHGRAVKIPMLFGDSHLAISDPLAVATIYGKFREVYDIPNWFSETMNSVFGPGLTSVRGKEHQRLRKLLNPVFSVRYIRDMVPTLSQITTELVTVLREQVSQPGTEVDISQYVSRYSLECVGRIGLGYSFGSLHHHGTDYSRALKEFGPTITKLHLPRLLLPWLRRTFPLSWLQCGADIIPWAPLRHMCGISKSVCMTSQQILQRKRELLKQNAEELGESKDLLSILLKQNMQSEDLSEANLIGHMGLLLLAGTDTTSSTITRVIEVLARNSEAQRRLRQELVEATTECDRSLSDFDYDTFSNLPYLEAVVRESIRMFPAFYQSPKMADEDTVLPLGTPILGRDGQLISELIVPSGTMVWINILGLNRDKDIWGPDADEWKPERWLAPLPPTVSEARIPSIFANTMTFIAGSRACIGYNLALIELRIAIAHLVLAFEFKPSEKEIEWRLGGIVSPSVKGSTSAKPELPVVITCN